MKRKYAVLILLLIIVGIFSSCSPVNTNDGLCDICKKESYSKLSDGNEYCYTHFKKALEYYLDD